jgi:dienelactone hydrolase
LTVVCVVFASGKQPPVAKTSGQDRPSRPFLEIFLANRDPPIITQKVIVQSAVGPVQGLLARPETKDRLPAVLVIPGKEGLTEWMRENTRDLSGIGYVVLALDLRPSQSQPSAPQKRGESLTDEPTLARLSAAVRWLRRRADLFPDRIGVVGWSSGGGQPLELSR